MHYPFLHYKSSYIYRSGLGTLAQATLLVCALLMFALLLSGTAVAKTKSAPFDGQWVINHEETDKVAIKYEDGSGVGKSLGPMKTEINIGMGLPLPQRFRQAPMSNLSPKDPAVLRCTEMQISTEGKKTHLVYDTEEKETLHSGHYRGRDTKKSRGKIQQKYKTPDRKVTKTWTMRDDGRLLVSVKLDPREDRARRFNRVFDRVTEATAVEGEPSPQ